MSVWYRNVPWATGDYWRTDISTNTLYSTTIVAARYALKDGPIVQVPLADLRVALKHAPTRKDCTIVGPYNIYPFKSVIGVLQRTAKVRMEFGPYHDLDYDRLTAYHDGKVVPVRHSRPHVPQDYFCFADSILEKIRRGESSFERVKERVEELNPTLTIRTRADGSISRDELAYCVRVNYLRAIRNSHEELL